MEQQGSLYSRVRRNYETMILVLLALFIFSLALISPVTYASSDSHFSLIVTQAILEHGTINLDAYYEIAPELFDAFDYQVDLQNGHWFYNYPSGSSIFSLPFVAIARLSGSDMLTVGDNHLWQNVISALVVAAVFLALYKIARVYLSIGPSLAISLITMLGSSLISTLSTALWNLGFAVLFVSLGLGLVARFDRGHSETVHPYWLGLLFFAAYLSRPSTAFFILAMLIYLALKDRRSLLRAGSISLALLIVYLLFSRVAYGSWFPDYYSVGSWLSPSGYLRALYGVLLSPSRGIFIFSPFLLLVAMGTLLYAVRKQRHLLFWLCGLWVSLQILSVAATPMWWGGYSFGPRLLTDAIPALVLMTAVLWLELAPILSKNQRRVVITIYFSLGLLAMFVNSYVGLFNVKNPLWNAYPSIDHYTEYLFSWDYPQFMVTNNKFHERRLDHHRQRLRENVGLLEPYIFGQTLTVTDDPNQAIFSGWWLANADTAWTEVTDTRILFVPEAIPDGELLLTLSAGSFGEQPIALYLNDALLGNLTITGDVASYELSVDSQLFKSNQLNEISLLVPGARNPALDELVQLGLRHAPHKLGLYNVAVQFTEKDDPG